MNQPNKQYTIHTQNFIHRIEIGSYIKEIIINTCILQIYSINYMCFRMFAYLLFVRFIHVLFVCLFVCYYCIEQLYLPDIW